MKRFLAIALAALSMGFVVSAEAKAADVSELSSATATTAQQYRRDRYYNNRRYNRARTVRQSRVVRYGRRLYRETYLVTYWPNGRTTTRLIDRDRIS